MTDPVDRERAISALDVSITLSAGAGTGKTTVLVRRLVGLLRLGTPPHRLAAITFTERAAGEILARTRDELEVAARSEPALRPALAAFGQLRVGTIHSFCRELLEAEALAAGWAPRVDLDTLPTEVSAADVAFYRWRRDFERREPPLGRLLRVLGAQTRRAAAAVATFRDLEVVVGADGFDPVAALRGLQGVVDGLDSAAAGCHAPDVDKLLANNRGLREALAEAVGVPGPWDAVTRVLASDPKVGRSGGRKQDWGPGGKEGFLEALDRYEAWRSDVLVQIHGVVVGDLRARYLPELRAEKARAGVAEFDDLLFRALELLEQDAARGRLAARFDAVLVDEVQDTDPIQARVAALLTRDPAVRGPWTAAPPRPGALFAVGDPKQSIYRFRRADVRTWSELEDLVARAGERRVLSRNFRSVPGLVGWVNHTFAGLPGYEPLVATRAAAELDPVVLVVAEDGEPVGAMIRHLLDLHAGGARVVDPATKVLRPLRWRDVMVLLPSWTHAEEVRDDLDRAGIPALVEGGGAFFLRDEIRLAVAALRAIDEPADAEATVFVLRGLFGFSHAELAAHAAAGGSWRPTVTAQPPGAVTDALAVLRELHGQRSRRSQVALLDAVLEHTRAPVVWSLRGDGLSRLANLDKLRAILRELEPTARTAGEVVERLRALAADGQEEDLSRSDVDADTVRVTSYFKAKGLEAPVVALVRASRNVPGQDAVVDRATGRLAVSLGAGLLPPDWDGLRGRDRAEDEAERARWMYVASTRARDQLVVVREPSAKDGLLVHLASGLPGRDATETHEGAVDLGGGVVVRVRHARALPPPPDRQGAFAGLDDAVDAALAAPAAATDEAASRRAKVRDAVRAAAARSRRWRSVHELAARSRVTGGDGGLGAAGGTVVHEVMQRLDLSRPREELLALLPALVPAVAGARRLEPGLAGRCQEVVERLLADPAADLARVAPERWQEVPFSFVDRGRAVSGTIDLCFPLDASRERWMVVDWKSSLPPRGSPLRDDYDRQLRWYAKALLATVGAVEVETRLVGPHPELGATSAEEQALAVVRELLAPGLRGLLDRGVPVPVVGLEVGAPVVAELELAWPARQLGLGLDLADPEVAALRALGWTVHVVATGSLGWPAAAVAALAVAWGLPRDEEEP